MDVETCERQDVRTGHVDAFQENVRFQRSVDDPWKGIFRQEKWRWIMTEDNF